MSIYSAVVFICYALCLCRMLAAFSLHSTCCHSFPLFSSFFWFLLFSVSTSLPHLPLLSNPNWSNLLQGKWQEPTKQTFFGNLNRSRLLIGNQSIGIGTWYPLPICLSISLFIHPFVRLVVCFCFVLLLFLYSLHIQQCLLRPFGRVSNFDHGHFFPALKCLFIFACAETLESLNERNQRPFRRRTY